MKQRTNTRTHDEFAADYDRLACEYGCFIPEALFGLCFEYVEPGDCLLDVGIGTGLSAWPFAKAGLDVYGIDASREMLHRCRLKSIAVKLQHYDIQTTPWPYAANYFDHVISCGVLHFLADLAPIFQEVARVIRRGGIFAFTTKAPPDRIDMGSEEYFQEVLEGMTVFSHRRVYIEELVAKHSFEPLKELRLGVRLDQEDIQGLFFAFVIRKGDHMEEAR